MQREWGGCMWWKEEHALILIGGKNDNWGDHPHFFIFLWIETKDARFVWIVVAAPRDKSESTLPVQGRWPSCWLFEWVEWTEFPYVDVDWMESEEAKTVLEDEDFEHSPSKLPTAKKHGGHEQREPPTAEALILDLRQMVSYLLVCFAAFHLVHVAPHNMRIDTSKSLLSSRSFSSSLLSSDEGGSGAAEDNIDVGASGIEGVEGASGAADLVQDSSGSSGTIGGPTGPTISPVEIARVRSEKSMPAALAGQEWFWKKLSDVTGENTQPLIPEFKVEVTDAPKK